MNAQKSDGGNNSGSGVPPMATGGEVLPTKQQTAGQQIMVWFLVIMVGVLFGMGPALGLITGPGGPEYADVKQSEATRFGQVQQNLDIILRGQSNQRDWTQHAQLIWQSRLAQEEGLMPEGKDLEAIVADFLNQEGRGGRSYGNLLEDYRDSDHAIRPADLQWFLQIEQAVDNLYARRLVVPATPSTAAAALRSAALDRVSVTAVELSAAALVDDHREAASADEITLQEAYDDLKEQWFRVPATRSVTLYVSDPDAIAPLLTPSEEDLQAWYEENRSGYSQWQVPADPDVDDDTEVAGADAEVEEESEPEYFALSGVRDSVLREMRRELAGPVAMNLQQRFETELQKLFATGSVVKAEDLSAEDLTAVIAASTLTPADEPLLTEAISLQVIPDVVITQPTTVGAAGERGLVVDVPTLGPARFSQDPFSPDLANGYIDYPRASRNAVGLTVRMHDRVPSTYQSFEQAREDVITWVAGQAAWAALLAAADDIASQSTELGEGGLATWFADEAEMTRWATAPVEQQVPVLRRLNAPPTELGGPEGATFEVTDLLNPELPVRVATAVSANGADIWSSLPRVRLVQARTYNRGVGAEEDSMTMINMSSMGGSDVFNSLYGSALQAYEARAYNEELQRRSQGN